MNPSAPLFSVLNNKVMAAFVARARERVVYVAPGIWQPVAAALVERGQAWSLREIVVSLDFNEQVLRLGYGELMAVESLRAGGIEVRHSPGLRTAFFIVDETGWVFTPTALLLEAEPRSEETPNALRLTLDQLRAVLLRVSPQVRSAAGAADPSAVLPPPEIGLLTVSSDQLREVKASIEQAPPVPFDVARQVQVFQPYLQYVELSLKGAKLQSHRVRIPKSLQNLGASKGLEGKLHTIFDLIEKNDALSSKALEDDLNRIRDDFARSLGKDHGRVVLKAAKPKLLERLKGVRAKLEAHQKKLETELATKLVESRRQVVDYYLPLARKAPPDVLLGGVFKVTDEDLRNWIEEELDTVFPEAEALLQRMVLEERYKDVTFETLNRPDFLDAIKEVFPRINWDKPFAEFKAAKEKPSDLEN